MIAIPMGWPPRQRSVQNSLSHIRFPILELVVGTGLTGTVFEGVGREFTTFHRGDGADLFQELVFVGRIHM